MTSRIQRHYRIIVHLADFVVGRKAVTTCAALLGVVFASALSSANGQDQKADALVPRSEQWRYLAGPKTVPEDWRTLNFDDSRWKTGRAGFGYGDGDDRTVLQDMQGNYTSVLIRRRFHVDNPAKHKQLYLYMNYDDGFIAHINGKRVANGSVTRNPTTGAIRLQTHEASGFEEFVIPDADKYLNKGDNVLAIEGFNAGKDSSDFSLDPILRATPKPRNKGRDATLLFTADEYRDDLDEFKRRLLDQSSYLTRRDWDYETALLEFRQTITDDMTPTEFTDGLRRIIAQIGDCHASVRAIVPPRIYGFLPFRIADTRDGLAALKLNANEPFNNRHPYIRSIDGHPMDAWLKVAGEYVAHGSPQFRRRRSLEYLAYFDLLRGDLNVTQSRDVKLEFQSRDGQTATSRGRLSRQPWSVATVRQKPTRLLQENIGYIRIPAMDERLINSMGKYMHQFRDTRGLVIDVRENSGGTYGITRALYPFFVPADAKPYVTNIAAYRLSQQFQRDHIEYRPTHRATWSEWDDVEQATIADAVRAFRPKWKPPEDLFSEWHFMLLSRKRSGRANGFPDDSEMLSYFHYRKPVVVLCNAGSFSATDGFLNAFQSLPNVTIMGEPSGGGSGATRRFRLPNTRVNIALSSMASFRPNGQTFDGHGVEVDVEIKPTLDDFLEKSDSVLDQAIKEISTSEVGS